MGEARRFDNIRIQSTPSLNLFRGSFYQQTFREAAAHLGNL